MQCAEQYGKVLLQSIEISRAGEDRGLHRQANDCRNDSEHKHCRKALQKREKSGKALQKR